LPVPFLASAPRCLHCYFRLFLLDVSTLYPPLCSPRPVPPIHLCRRPAGPLYRLASRGFLCVQCQWASGQIPDSSIGVLSLGAGLLSRATPFPSWASFPTAKVFVPFPSVVLMFSVAETCAVTGTRTRGCIYVPSCYYVRAYSVLPFKTCSRCGELACT